MKDDLELILEELESLKSLIASTYGERLKKHREGPPPGPPPGPPGEEAPPAVLIGLSAEPDIEEEDEDEEDRRRRW
jgi:hypothetical protein